MDSGKRVTSIFIAVAILALAALAITVGRRQPADSEPDMSVLPGLAENLRSVAQLTGYPLQNIRTIIVTRTNGDSLIIERPEYGSAFMIKATPMKSDTASYSAILFANAVFMNELGASANSFVVTGAQPEQRLGQLEYSGFDGFVLENSVFRASNATWLKIKTGYDPRLTIDQDQSDTLLSKAEVQDLIRRLQGRMYKKPDIPPE